MEQRSTLTADSTHPLQGAPYFAKVYGSWIEVALTGKAVEEHRRLRIGAGQAGTFGTGGLKLDLKVAGQLPATRADFDIVAGRDYSFGPRAQRSCN